MINEGDDILTFSNDDEVMLTPVPPKDKLQNMLKLSTCFTLKLFLSSDFETYSTARVQHVCTEEDVGLLEAWSLAAASVCRSLACG